MSTILEKIAAIESEVGRGYITNCRILIVQYTKKYTYFFDHTVLVLFTMALKVNGYTVTLYLFTDGSNAKE